MRFTCPKCSSKDVNCVYEKFSTEYFVSRVICSCHDRDSEFAAERKYHVDVLEWVTEYGYFDKDDNWEIEDEEREEIERVEVEDDIQIHCTKCFEEADETCWITNQLNPEDWGEYPEIGDSYYVCSRCGSKLIIQGNRFIPLQDQKQKEDKSGGS